jgi:quinol monooxygenase YgiN
MLKHVVIWNLKDRSRKAEHVATIQAALAQMRGNIPGMVSVEFAADIGFDRQPRDVVLYAEFTDAAALELYQDHPVHVAFKAVIGPLVQDRVAADWIV